MKFSFISPSPEPETSGKVEAAWPPLGIYLGPEMLFKEIARTFKSSFRMAAFSAT